mmetsp:Transcript_78681/g.138774  ORF Transcript_78681/g.138774 Transcript_78681/m.138774 type:complete len:193 (-) Transcript_78681:203-781(-)
MQKEQQLLNKTRGRYIRLLMHGLSESDNAGGGADYSMVCRAAYPNGLKWLKVGGKIVYTNTIEECIAHVKKHCPNKNAFTYSAEKKNRCPGHCVHGWKNDCGDCAGCGCVPPLKPTPCPTQIGGGNWRNNCVNRGPIGNTYWSCHRMGHTHTYSIKLPKTCKCRNGNAATGASCKNGAAREDSRREWDCLQG